MFFLPRLLIPVTSSYGTSLHYRVDTPNRTLYLSELRMSLAWPPKPDTPINLVLVLGLLLGMEAKISEMALAPIGTALFNRMDTPGLGGAQAVTT